MPAVFKLHGVEIEISDDSSESLVREIVHRDGRKVAGKVLQTFKRTDEVTAESAAIGWAKARRIKAAADEAKAVDEADGGKRKKKG